MRRILALTLFLLAAGAAPAAAQSTGGALYVPAPRGFSVTPASVAPGAPVTFAFRAAAPGAHVRARVDLLAPGRPAVRARLGLVRTGRRLTVRWTAAVPAGPYTGRLVLRRGRPGRGVAARGPAAGPGGHYTGRLVLGRGAQASAYARVALDVVAPPPPTGVFPVQGPYTLGDRFGVTRTGHTHQGQDIAAAAGTPVVAPVAGSVHWTAYQAAGAGYYAVVYGADARAYVFMHLLAGSTAAAKGRPVTAGQRLGLVGATGDATGPHLHFEIWTGGWYASSASAPIDPLPDLLAWAA